MLKMIKNTSKVLSLLLLTSTLSASAFAANSNAKSKGLDPNTVVAEFNGNKIKAKTVSEYFEKIFKNQPQMKDKKFLEMEKPMRDNLIKGYLDSMIVEKEALNSGLENSKEFKEKIDNMKNQILQQMFLDGKIKTHVTEAKIKDEYNKFKKENSSKKEYKAKHILVEDEKVANEIKSKLDKGAKFEDLAKEYSKDEGSKVNGGDLGYFTKGQLVPEFEAVAFSLKKGEVSKPVKSQFGFHIIRLEDKRNVKIPSLDDIRSQIEGKLSREAFEKIIAELEKKHNVKFLDK